MSAHCHDGIEELSRGSITAFLSLPHSFPKWSPFLSLSLALKQRYSWQAIHYSSSSWTCASPCVFGQVMDKRSVIENPLSLAQGHCSALTYTHTPTLHVEASLMLRPSDQVVPLKRSCEICRVHSFDNSI